MTDQETSHPTVFITYSWDDEAHKNWVIEFAKRLVLNGVDARIDDWNVQPGESLTSFMERQIMECDFTLIICTPNYAARSLGRSGGVGYEQQIISGALVSGELRKKFIPLLRRGNFETGKDCGIPPHFLGIRAVDVRDDEKFDLKMEEILRVIYRKPALLRPAIGSAPPFASPMAPQTGVRTARLATIELDGWHLLSGVGYNEKYPETFHIPDSLTREQKDVGDLVKLYFEIALPRRKSDTPFEDDLLDEDGDVQMQLERMWVKITGHDGPYRIGELDSIPSFIMEYESALEIEAWEDKIYERELRTREYEPYYYPSLKMLPVLNRINLKYGCKVYFLPEHIIGEHTGSDLTSAIDSIDTKD